jgi:integrase
MLLARNTNLNEPQQVLSFIANHNVTNGTKQSLCYAYKKYCKQYQIVAEIPFYQPQAKPIKVPTKEKLLIFITNASRRLATKLTLSMETGLRPIEVHSLKVKDIDLEQKLVYPITAKHGAPRPPLKISNQLQKMLTPYIAFKNQSEIVFSQTTAQYGKNFRHLRNRLAKKLQDPTLKNIRLYDFRHYFCTKKLYDTQNAYVVMNLMGHKRLETTQKYMHLLNLEESEWECKGATNKQEATHLIEAGFEYVTEIDGTKLFKKRK